MPLSLSGNGTITGNVSFANSVTLSTVTATTVSANSINSSSYVSANSHVITGINYALGPQTMKNRIINGDMRIDQRFAGAANNNIAGAQYNVDRWLHNGSSGSTAAKLRFQQNNTNGPGTSATQTATGFTNYFGANTVTANTTINAGDYWIMAQLVEGFNIGDFNWGTANASPVTLSFWVYSSVSGTHAGSLRNGNADRSYPFTYTISTANTWQYQTVIVPGDTTGTWYTNSSGGVTLTFSLGTGSTLTSSTAGSWQAGNYFNVTNAVNVVSNANGSFYLTGVQLEKGTQATSWDWRHYTTELQLCQRYYQYFGGTSSFLIGGYGGVSGGDIYSMFIFPVQMRTTPIVTSLGSWSRTNVTTASPRISRESSFGFMAYATLSAAGNWYFDANSSSTLITVSAELGVTN